MTSTEVLPYGDAHKFFLQQMMHSKIMQLSNAITLYITASNLSPNPVKFSKESDVFQFVKVINKQIKCFGLEIKRTRDEDSATCYYGLVCNNESDHFKLLCKYTPAQLEFFQMLITKIFHSQDHEISSTHAMNLVLEMKNKMTQLNAENMLKEFVTENLIKERNGNLCIGVRTLLEFEPYFRKTFPQDIKMCYLCQIFILKGLNCESCGVKIHHHCSVKYFTNHKDSNSCPHCSEKWEHKIIRIHEDKDKKNELEKKRKSFTDTPRVSKRLSGDQSQAT